MKKLASSFFVLLLLGVSLWSASSWYMGTKTESYFLKFVERTKESTNTLFYVDLLNYERSVFTAKAIVKLNVNKEHHVSRLFENTVNDLNGHEFIIDILHGPLFFHSSGITKGSSSLAFELDQHIKQGVSLALMNTTASINFEDVLQYKMPLSLVGNISSALLITGLFDLNTGSHKGFIESNELIYKDDYQSIIASDILLHYEQSEPNNYEKIKFDVSGLFPSIRYGFSLFSEELVFESDYIGGFSFINDEFSLYSQLLFDMTADNQSQYPIEKGDLRFTVSSLSLDSLRDLDIKLSDVQNIQEQVQWVLEDQGEFPEGQDKIWELQDRELRYLRKLPQSVADVIFLEGISSDNGVHNIEDASIRFYLKTEYNNEDSTINGAIYPNELEGSVLDVSLLSLNSLIYPLADVRINDDWLTYLSARYPINKNNFTLTYKNNQLLMQ